MIPCHESEVEGAPSGLSLVGKLIDGIVDVDSSDDVEEDVEDAEDGGRRSWHQHLRVDMTKQHLDCSWREDVIEDRIDETRHLVSPLALSWWSCKSWAFLDGFHSCDCPND